MCLLNPCTKIIFIGLKGDFILIKGTSYIFGKLVPCYSETMYLLCLLVDQCRILICMSKVFESKRKDLHSKRELGLNYLIVSA